MSADARSGSGAAMPPLPATPTGRYRHYNGGEYEVLGVVRHSESLEPMVLYRPLAGDGALWVRPHAMFFGMLDAGGVPTKRFAPIPPAPQCEQTGDDALARHDAVPVPQPAHGGDARRAGDHVVIDGPWVPD